MTNKIGPCGFDRVGCGHKCGTCGFNPAEAARRVREGHYIIEEVTHYLCDDNDKVVHVATRKCKKLVFPPKKERLA